VCIRLKAFDFVGWCIRERAPPPTHPHPRTHPYKRTFNPTRYRRSLEDIVGLTVVRAAVLSVVYAVGMRHMHRPYLYTSYLLAAM
jgi:hypothetical protein